MASWLKEPDMFDMKQSTKYWLMGSIFVLAINIAIFVFRNSFELSILIWVVVLTPITWLVLYFLTNLLDRSDKKRENLQS
jgi:hypothetical protein